MKIHDLRSKWSFFILCLGMHACGVADVSSLDGIRERLFSVGLKEDPSKRASIFRFDAGMNLEEQVGQLLSRQFGDERWKAMSASKSSTANRSTESFALTYDNVPVCNAQVAVHHFNNSDRTVALSHLPSPETSIQSDRIVDSLDIPGMLRAELSRQDISDQNLAIGSEDDCYYASDANGLIRAKDVHFNTDELSYRALVSADKVLVISPNFFDVTGKAKVYSSNPVDGKLKEFTLDGLVSDGTLENDYFTTSTTGTKAEEADHIYEYATTDGRFDETSLFVHANEQLSFFKDLGYKWTSKDKINIFVHAVVNGSVNNALYTPASGTNPPKIQVGDGDNVRLKNLPKDADVVRHELGHHIVYDTLKSTRGESLVMHEGLADFFAFAFSGDPCLGESICPEDSPIKCEVEKDSKNSGCLRTAKNDYILNKNTKPEAHFKSQFVSGMLWDLRDDVGADNLTQLVYDSVGLLLSESGYHDLVLAMLIAEKENTKGKFCQKIYDSASYRGLDSYMSDFGCGEDLPALSALDNAGGETDTTTTTAKRSGGNNGGLFNCGMVGGAEHQIPSIALLMIGLAAPILLRKRRQE